MRNPFARRITQWPTIAIIAGNHIIDIPAVWVRPFTGHWGVCIEDFRGGGSEILTPDTYLDTDRWQEQASEEIAVLGWTWHPKCEWLRHPKSPGLMYRAVIIPK